MHPPGPAVVAGSAGLQAAVAVAGLRAEAEGVAIVAAAAEGAGGISRQTYSSDLYIAGSR